MGKEQSRVKTRIYTAIEITLAIATIWGLSYYLRLPTVDAINSSTHTGVASCWEGDDIAQYVPTTVPTQEKSPEYQVMVTAVEEEVRAQISGTQEVLVETHDPFQEIGEEYTSAVVRYVLWVPDEFEDSEDLLRPHSAGSAFMVAAEYVKTRMSNEPSPLWFFLTSNHVIDEESLRSIEQGDMFGFEFQGVNAQTAQLDGSHVFAHIVGCRKIIQDGFHVATLIAARGIPGSSPEGSHTSPLAPFPRDRIGGPCVLEDRLKMISFPVSQSEHVQPFISVVDGPFLPFEGADSNGVVTRGIWGRGLANSGSSGGNLMDPKGDICAVVNYSMENRTDLVGFQILPTKQNMHEIIGTFIDEQIELLSKTDW